VVGHRSRRARRERESCELSWSVLVADPILLVVLEEANRDLRISYQGHAQRKDVRNFG
jgi:hypothetical protein